MNRYFEIIGVCRREDFVGARQEDQGSSDGNFPVPISERRHWLNEQIEGPCGSAPDTANQSN